MKKIISITLLVISTLSVFAQPPKFSYQTIIRDAKGQLVIETELNFVIRLRANSADGDIAYEETHIAPTNENGLVSIEIGAGSVNKGDITTIEWDKYDFYLETLTDPLGGTDYSLVSASQLLSVPYAMYAGKSGVSGNNVGDMRYWDGENWVLLEKGNNGQYLQVDPNGKPAWTGVEKPLNPVLGTVLASDVELASATLKSEVFGDGGNTVTSRGFVLSTSNEPTINDRVITVGNGVGAFNADVRYLKTNTTYYARAYATNSMGVAYGTEVSFKTKEAKIGEIGPAGGIVFYLDGNGGGLECVQKANEFQDLWEDKPNTQYAYYTYANDTAIGTGDFNTQKILSVIPSGANAAYKCSTLDINGYDDWYLPSLGEMLRLKNVLLKKGVGSLEYDKYWTSSQEQGTSSTAAIFVVDISGNRDYPYNRSTGNYYVRPVRKF